MEITLLQFDFRHRAVEFVSYLKFDLFNKIVLCIYLARDPVSCVKSITLRKVLQAESRNSTNIFRHVFIYQNLADNSWAYKKQIIYKQTRAVVF